MVLPSAHHGAVITTGTLARTSCPRSRCRLFLVPAATREALKRALPLPPAFTPKLPARHGRSRASGANNSGCCAADRPARPQPAPHRSADPIVNTNVHHWPAIAGPSIIPACGSFAASWKQQSRTPLWRASARARSPAWKSSETKFTSTGPGGLSLATPQTPPPSLVSVPNTARRASRGVWGLQ